MLAERRLRGFPTAIGLPRLLPAVLVILLSLGATRALVLTLASPMVGYADNYDMLRFMAPFDLWPVHAVRALAHSNAPMRQYAFGDFGPDCSVYSSEMLLLAPVVGWMWVFDHVTPGATFDLRALGFWHSLLLILLAAWYSRQFYRSGHANAALLNAAVFALLLTDPTNTLFFNTLYAEQGAVLFGYFAFVAGLHALFERDRGGLWLVFAVGVLLFGTSKPQHLPTAVLLALGVLAVDCVISRRLPLRFGTAVTVALALAVGFTCWNASRPDPLAMAINCCNKVNSVAGAILPLTKDPPRAIRQLGLPDECISLVGKTYYSAGMDSDPRREYVRTLSRTRLLRLFWDDFGLPWRLLYKAAMELEHPTYGSNKHEGLLLTYLGQVEGGRLAKVPFPTFATLLHASWPWSGRLLLIAPAVLAVLYGLRGGWRLWAGPSQTLGIGSPLIICSMLGYACLFVSVVGDGYWELPKHNHLAFNFLILACLLAIAHLAGFLNGLVKSRYYTAAPVAESPLPVPKSGHRAMVVALASLLLFVAPAVPVAVLTERPRSPTLPASTTAVSPSNELVVESVAPNGRGSLRVLGSTTDCQKRGPVTRLLLVTDHRIRSCPAFPRSSPTASRYDWVSFLPERGIQQKPSEALVFAEFKDGALLPMGPVTMLTQSQGRERKP